MIANTKYDSKRPLKQGHLYRVTLPVSRGEPGETGSVKYPNATWNGAAPGDILLFLERFRNFYSARIPVKKFSAVFFNLKTKTFFVLEDDSGYWDDAFTELPLKHPLAEYKVNAGQDNQP